MLIPVIRVTIAVPPQISRQIVRNIPPIKAVSNPIKPRRFVGARLADLRGLGVGFAFFLAAAPYRLSATNWPPFLPFLIIRCLRHFWCLSAIIRGAFTNVENADGVCGTL